MKIFLMVLFLGIVLIVLPYGLNRVRSTSFPAQPALSPGESSPPLQTNDQLKQQILRDIVTSGVNCVDVTGEKRCTVDLVVGTYAKGRMPLAYWMAVRTNGIWNVVVTGNGIPQCSEVERYEIPKEIYGNCLEVSGELRF